MSSKVEFKVVGETLPLDVVATSFTSTEELSSLYAVEVEFTTLDDAFDPASTLRKSITLVVMDTDRGRARTMSGVCNRCELVHYDGVRLHYRATLAPKLASLQHRQDSRIYQDTNVIDIVKQVFAAAGIDKVDYRLTNPYLAREYVVQYRESELEFVQRLLEDEGIFYFFEHEEGESTLVIADSVDAISADTKVPITFAMSQGFGGTDSLTDFRYTRRLRASNVRLRDFDFEKPQQHPVASVPAEANYPIPYFEYPGGFTNAALGQRRASVRLSEKRRDADTVHGSSGAGTIEVGKIISVVGAAQEPLNGRFFITKLVCRGTQSLAGGEADPKEKQNTVLNQFSGIPDGSPWAPPRKTKRPLIRGTQTAVVTGPSMGDEEIHVDRYGRIKVRFHWDRVGQFDDRSSCWIRVLQVPLGGIILPRVGWEVSVAFLEGDPDHPVVTGRVYNAERVPPYALPATKTSGSIKSSSSPGGAGVNEINLADAGGSQGFSISAQKDLNVTVGYDQNETVAVNDKTIIKVNSTTSVGSNQSVLVSGSQTVSVGSQQSANVAGNINISVGGNAVDNATANYVEKVGADRSNTVGGNMMLICNSIQHTIAGNLARDVGAVQLLASIASVTTEVAGNSTETIGIAKVDLCKGGWSETITGNKMCQVAVGELAVVKGSYTSSSDASMTTLIGALRYAKVTGDYTVKAPVITLLGATGSFKGAGSELKLGGAPIVVKGTKVAMKTALVVKLGGSLKMGS